MVKDSSCVVQVKLMSNLNFSHLVKLKSIFSNLQSVWVWKEKAFPDILPELLGFLQLSLHKRSAIADFHLLGRSASSHLSCLSLEDNKQTMQTLTWKSFTWSGKWFLAVKNDSSYHMWHPIKTTLAKRSHVHLLHLTWKQQALIISLNKIFFCNSSTMEKS